MDGPDGAGKVWLHLGVALLLAVLRKDPPECAQRQVYSCSDTCWRSPGWMGWKGPERALVLGSGELEPEWRGGGVLMSTL